MRDIDLDYDAIPESELVFSPDRKRAAAWWISDQHSDLWDSDTSYAIRVWNVATRNKVKTFYRSWNQCAAGTDGSPVHGVQFTPDSSALIITTGEDAIAEPLPPWTEAEDGDPLLRQRVRVLSLRGNRIGPDFAPALVRSKQVERVSELDLAGNGIGDVGARAIADAPSLARLTRIDLSGNGITRVGARALASSTHLLRLTHLDISGNKIGVGLEALTQRFGAALAFRPKEKITEGREGGWKMSDVERAASQAVTGKMTLAKQVSTAGGGPDFVCFLPDARLVPPDPQTSFVIRPASSNVSVEGFYLEFIPAIEEVARATLARLVAALRR